MHKLKEKSNYLLAIYVVGTNELEGSALLCLPTQWDLWWLFTD